MKYWHEIPQDEVNNLLAKPSVTVQYVLDNYKQPDWCGYNDALDPMMGCWSLTGNAPNGTRTRICKEFCKGCELFSQPQSQNNTNPETDNQPDPPL